MQTVPTVPGVTSAPIKRALPTSFPAGGAQSEAVRPQAVQLSRPVSGTDVILQQQSTVPGVGGADGEKVIPANPLRAAVMIFNLNAAGGPKLYVGGNAQNKPNPTVQKGIPIEGQGSLTLAVTGELRVNATAISSWWFVEILGGVTQ